MQGSPTGADPAPATPAALLPGRPTGQQRRIRHVLLIALAVNVLMGLLKLVVGLMGGSLAVVADAMHSATDAFSSLMALLSNGLADPRPDRDHPYGHHKYESVGALAIAAFILFAAFEILQSAFARWQGGLMPLRLDWGDLTLLLVAMLANVLLASYERRQGRRLRSRLLAADALHTWSDIWTTLVLLIGLGGAIWFDLPWLDVVLAVPLALLLVKVCWGVLQDNLPLLVDQIALPPEAIHQVAMGVPGVLNCHDIASRGVVGQQVFIDMHMVVAADDLPTAHRITELVEEHLEARYGPVRCTIHLEPREYASAAITFRGTHG
jgi:cation diffusion facilitator family transporter